MGFPNTWRRVSVCALLILVSTAVVWAATKVTITKSYSYSASTSRYDGSTVTMVSLQETNNGIYLSYIVYEVDYSQVPPKIVYLERGGGEIDSKDGSVSSSGASVCVDTSDMATIGDGGLLELEWVPDGVMYHDTVSKVTSDDGTIRTIRFGGFGSSSTVVAGGVFGEDYNGTGYIYSNRGKVIMQVK